MKGYKKKIAAALALLTCVTAVSGCDFIVKEAPINIESTYSDSNNTPDTAASGSDSEESEQESESEKKEKDTSAESSKNESKDKDNSSSESKSSSSKSSSSKAASSKSTSSGSASSKSSTTSSKTTSSSSNKVNGISLDIREVTLEIGQTKMPVVTIMPSTAANKAEIWTSSDEKIATVDKNGIIKAVAEGKCTVTVTSADNSKVSAAVSVTVKKKPTVESISVNFTETSIKIGESVMPTVTMTPQNADTLEESWESSDESIASVDRYGNITGHSKGVCKVTVKSVSNPKVSQVITVTVRGDDDSSIDTGSSGETYIDGVLIVNKTYGLPSSYNPGGLTGECAQHFESLRHGAANDGITIYLSSGFRSYEEQSRLYNSYLNLYGEAYTDTFSARPGHSEHQTGLAIDCNIVDDSFIGTAEAEWLAEHCYEYGFIIRYPQGKESITGYKYEPWHIRYVGEDLAKELHYSGQTLEEYFGINSSY